MEKSKAKAEIGSVFMYRINVAIAVILVFLNIQMLVYAIMTEDGQNPVVSATILGVCLLYGAWAINGMGQKYFVYTDAIEYRSLFRRWYFMSGDIDKAQFARKDVVRMRITLDVKNNKRIIINTKSLKNPQPLIDFCAKFKVSEG